MCGSKIRGKQADLIIMDDITEFPPVKHDDTVDGAKYMTFDLKTTVTGRTSGGPAIQQVPRTLDAYKKAWNAMMYMKGSSNGWPAYWLYQFRIEPEFRVYEDGEREFKCNNYKYRTMKKDFMPLKYETAILMLNAAREGDYAHIKGIGWSNLCQDHDDDRKYYKYLFDF